MRRGLCVKNAEAAPIPSPRGHWFAGSLIPGLHPTRHAKRLVCQCGSIFWRWALTGFKTDGGEFVCRADACFHDGSTGREGQTDTPGTMRRATGASRATTVPVQPSGYAGTPPCPSTGRGSASQNSELKSVLRAGLSRRCQRYLVLGF